jgi:hypothetical protein
MAESIWIHFPKLVLWNTALQRISNFERICPEDEFASLRKNSIESKKCALNLKLNKFQCQRYPQNMLLHFPMEFTGETLILFRRKNFPFSTGNFKLIQLLQLWHDCSKTNDLFFGLGFTSVLVLIYIEEIKGCIPSHNASW